MEYPNIVLVDSEVRIAGRYHPQKLVLLLTRDLVTKFHGRQGQVSPGNCLGRPALIQQAMLLQPPFGLS